MRKVDFGGIKCLYVIYKKIRHIIWYQQLVLSNWSLFISLSCLIFVCSINFAYSNWEKNPNNAEIIVSMNYKGEVKGDC